LFCRRQKSYLAFITAKQQNVERPFSSYLLLKNHPKVTAISKEIERVIE
jgi:hypothetical protein